MQKHSGYKGKHSSSLLLALFLLLLLFPEPPPRILDCFSFEREDNRDAPYLGGTRLQNPYRCLPLPSVKTKVKKELSLSGSPLGLTVPVLVAVEGDKFATGKQKCSMFCVEACLRSPLTEAEVELDEDPAFSVRLFPLFIVEFPKEEFELKGSEEGEVEEEEEEG